VHRNLAKRARVVICGQIADYNEAPPDAGSRTLGFMIVRRVQMEGFLVGDFAHQFEPAIERLRRWLVEGRLRYREDVVEGLERAPRAFIGLLRGENRGKLLVKVAEP
jgi:NADPH-dependent curcumin reductase CurA